MRRSKAPSVLNNAKRLCNTNNTAEGDCYSDGADEQYAWGSRNVNLKKSKYENKRVFKVVWRDVSTKKYKTWKGDGTLEIDIDFRKAILKDETGKYIGCSTKFNVHELVPDFSMIIGSKEIEIQNEIIKDQLHEHRTRQLENHVEEFISSEDNDKEGKKPKGGFKFNPILVLNPPKIKSDVVKNIANKNILNSNSKNESSFRIPNLSISPLQTYLNDKPCREFICFLRQSELQEFLFKTVIEYISSAKSRLTLDAIKSLEIDHVLQNICNHPSLINHKTTANKLVRHLIPTLPDWTEMGPFDSSKLEFVQYFLADLRSDNPQVCAILAKNVNVLNMLQGLCDFMNIKCLRLEDIETRIIIEFCTSKHDSTRVLLINSEKILKSFDFFIYCKKIIVFEDVSKSLNTFGLRNAVDVTIYNLVTAFSIEELFLFNTYDGNMEILCDELVNIINTENDCCYTHSKIECNCFKGANVNKKSNNTFKEDWNHFKSPFGAQLLKIFSLENCAENIVSIFSKKNFVQFEN